MINSHRFIVNEINHNFKRVSPGVKPDYVIFFTTNDIKRMVVFLVGFFILSNLYAQTTSTYRAWEMAYLANATYHNDVPFTSLVRGFKSERLIAGSDGFQAVKYGNSDTVVISYRGTDELMDGLVDS